MRHSWTAASFGTLGLLAGGAGAFGQSLNIRFGSAVSTPSAAYAGAGLPGAWNTFQVTPDYGLEPLVSLQGTAVPAQFYQYCSSSMLTYNNPLTSGDDKKLMDSMILSTNNPTDGCFWVQVLMLGPYEVTIYAMTPDDPSRQCRTRVDNGSPGPTMVGGAWPGHQQAGVTYSRFNVTTSDGVIAFHDGLYGGVLQSGMNGVQFRFLGPCPTPSFSTQPASATTCQNGHAGFSVGVTGTGPFGYQWQIQTSPGVWQAMGNDPGPLPCGGGAFSYATPLNSPTVQIGIAPCPGVTSYQVRCAVSNACGTSFSNEATYSICFANCDCSTASPVLNVGDFSCFLTRYAAQDPYANCDGSTAPPVLNVADFTCFLTKYAAGCP